MFPLSQAKVPRSPRVRNRRLLRLLCEDRFGINFRDLKKILLHRLGLPALALLCVRLTISAAPVPGTAINAPVDRSRWPAALRNVPLERLSSGAISLLDRGGDLVRSPSAPTAPQIEALAAVALDLRVAPNLRLGDDPPQLPPTMRAQAEPHIARSQADPEMFMNPRSSMVC